MAIGLEAKGYRESETRAENVTGIAKRLRRETKEPRN
jgi:hypothetical protein